MARSLSARDVLTKGAIENVQLLQLPFIQIITRAKYCVRLPDYAKLAGSPCVCVSF